MVYPPLMLALLPPLQNLHRPSKNLPRPKSLHQLQRISLRLQQLLLKKLPRQQQVSLLPLLLPPRKHCPKQTASPPQTYF